MRNSPMCSSHQHNPSLPAQPGSNRVILEATTTLPTRHGTFQCHAFRACGSNTTHIALTLGQVAGYPGVLTRLHSECLTGDVFGSCRCDCGEQLEQALARIAACGRGILLYLRDHEGRGIGLANKIRAYALQEQGLDTVDANLRLGFPADARDYGAAAAMLHSLSAQSVCLMTNNPKKVKALTSLGIEVEDRQELQPAIRPENAYYLHTKQAKLGHLRSSIFVADNNRHALLHPNVTYPLI